MSATQTITDKYLNIQVTLTIRLLFESSVAVFKVSEDVLSFPACKDLVILIHYRIKWGKPLLSLSSVHLYLE